MGWGTSKNKHQPVLVSLQKNSKKKKHYKENSTFLCSREQIGEKNIPVKE